VAVAVTVELRPSFERRRRDGGDGESGKWHRRHRGVGIGGGSESRSRGDACEEAHIAQDDGWSQRKKTGQATGGEEEVFA